MPKGPKGQKRPADVISSAVLVMKIATGEAEETVCSKGHAGGVKGGAVRARRLSDTARSEIARVAAEARWKRGR